MKKYFTLLICLFLCLNLTGCSKKEYVVSLGDGLPSYSSTTRFVEAEFETANDKQKYVTNAYLYDDGNMLVLYRFHNDGKTLEQIMEDEIKNYFDNGNYEISIQDNWEVDNDFHYGYFMAYHPNDYDEPYYTQNYYFLDGQDVVQAQFWLISIHMPLAAEGWTIDLPIGYDNGTLIKSEITDDAIAKFIPRDSEEYPSLNIYMWDSEYDNYVDFAEEELSEQYEMRTYNIHNFVDRFGNKQNVLVSIYDEDDEGELETNYDITINCGEYFLSFDFFVDIDDDYIKYACPAIASSIAFNNNYGE